MKKLINQRPSHTLKIFLGLLPFALLIVLYMAGSDARLAENPNDKLLPSFSQIGDGLSRMALEPSKRTGDYLFWQDTASSLTRLGLGIAIFWGFSSDGGWPEVRAVLSMPWGLVTLLEIFVKAQVDIYLLVGRAIKRPNG